MTQNIYGLHYHRGEELLRWRRGIASGVGGILKEDLFDYLESIGWTVIPISSETE
jgi:hypothetical protein